MKSIPWKIGILSIFVIPILYKLYITNIKMFVTVILMASVIAVGAGIAEIVTRNSIRESKERWNRIQAEMNKLNEQIHNCEDMDWNRYHSRFERDDYVEIIDDPSITYLNMVAERKRKNEEDGYTILGVEFDDTDVEIKSAYRRLMTRNHPDKFESKGLTEDQMREAKEQTQKINKAYQKICERRGI